MVYHVEISIREGEAVRVAHHHVEASHFAAVGEWVEKEIEEQRLVGDTYELIIRPMLPHWPKPEVPVIRL